MPWTERRRRFAARILMGCAAVAVLGLGFLRAADEKQLQVFAPQGHYAVPVVQHGGHEYVSLAAVLNPLGGVTTKADGKKFKLRFTPPGGKPQEAQFNAGKARGKVPGGEVELAAPFLIENGDGLVPIASLPNTMIGWVSRQIDLYPHSRRLLLGGVAVHYQAELEPGPEPRLLLHFSQPVDPVIATAPGRVRMTFTRTPVVGSGEQSFDDKQIASADFKETDGEAEMVVSGSGALMATFSADRRTITIAPAPRPAAPAAAAPAPAATAPAQTAAPPVPAPVASAPPRSRFLVVIDAAHGGSETGAMLPGQVAEKDLTLAFARRLQAAFDQQGVATLMLRNDDSTLSFDQRATAANAARPALYLAIHVSADGRGARIFTDRIPAPTSQRPAFLPWATAQSWFLDASHAAAGSIAAEFSKRQVAIAAYAAEVPPLDNLACAALAVEIAPLQSAALNSPGYQQAVANAIVAGVAAVRPQLEAAR